MGPGVNRSLDVSIYALQDLLVQVADPKVKAWWEGYVKQGAPFYGVKMPQIRALVHRWHSDQVSGNLDQAAQIELALALFRERHTEEKLAAILLLHEILLPFGVLDCTRDIDRFATLFQSGAIADWNVCDWFCVKVLAALIQTHGEPCARLIAEWHQAPNLWQARASLVPFTRVAGDPLYYSLIERSCETLIRRPERFAKTAVGWILRDISRHDSAFVERLLGAHLASFSTESLRNATKHFEPDRQQRYIQRLKDVVHGGRPPSATGDSRTGPE